MARRFWIIGLAFVLLLFVGDFVWITVLFVQRLINHRVVPIGYFVGLAIDAYVAWMVFPRLRQELGAGDAEKKNAPTT